MTPTAKPQQSVRFSGSGLEMKRHIVGVLRKCSMAAPRLNSQSAPGPLDT